MFVLFTDFGVADPYQAQLKTVIYRRIPDAIIIDLFSSLLPYGVKAAAYLIPAYLREFPANSIFLCVVDPGVGSERKPVMLKLDGQWFVGPDNGLFEILWRRAKEREIYHIDWQPEVLSSSFHGRDIFAVVACDLHQQRVPDHSVLSRPDKSASDWPDELFEVIYIDHYGNAISGIQCSSVTVKSILMLNDNQLVNARTYSEVPDQTPFWYINSNDLVEIAVSQGSAEVKLSICCGDQISIRS